MTSILLLNYDDFGWTGALFTPHFLPFQALLPRDLAENLLLHHYYEVLLQSSSSSGFPVVRYYRHW